MAAPSSNDLARRGCSGGRCAPQGRRSQRRGPVSPPRRRRPEQAGQLARPRVACGRRAAAGGSRPRGSGARRPGRTRSACGRTAPGQAADGEGQPAVGALLVVTRGRDGSERAGRSRGGSGSPAGGPRPGRWLWPVPGPRRSASRRYSCSTGGGSSVSDVIGASLDDVAGEGAIGQRVGGVAGLGQRSSAGAARTRSQGVAEGRRHQGEAVPGQLHPVAGVAGKADDDPPQRLAGTIGARVIGPRPTRPAGPRCGWRSGASSVSGRRRPRATAAALAGAAPPSRRTR